MNEKTNNRFYLIILSVLGFIGVGILVYFLVLSYQIENDRDNKTTELTETQDEKRQVEIISDDQANKVLSLCQGNGSVARALRAEGVCTGAQVIKEVITEGPRGLQGIPGIPGRDGKDGKDGKNGRNPPCLAEPNRCQGEDGRDGRSGIDGTDGTDGVNGQTPPCMSEPNQCRGQDGSDGDPGPTCPEGYTATQTTRDNGTPADESDDYQVIECRRPVSN